jgi:trypsin-like peptidase
MSRLKFFDRVKKATVAIVMESGSLQRTFTIVGSGFCIHSEGIIATSERVFRVFFDERAYLETIKDLPEVTTPRLIKRQYIERQPRVMFRGVRGKQMSMPVIGIAEAVTKLGFDITLFKLPKHERFPNGYPTIEIADYRELQEKQEIATCGFPLCDNLFDYGGRVTSSFTSGRIRTIIPLAGVPASDVKGYELDLTAANGDGGPAFSLKSGKVFGVLQGGIIQPGIIKAEPLHPIIEEGVVQRLIDGTHRPPGL